MEDIIYNYIIKQLSEVPMILIWMLLDIGQHNGEF